MHAKGLTGIRNKQLASVLPLQFKQSVSNRPGILSSGLSLHRQPSFLLSSSIQLPLRRSTAAMAYPPGSSFTLPNNPSALLGSEIPWTAPLKSERLGTIYWLRLDLRVHDNPSLIEAIRLAAEEVGGGAKTPGPLTICYIDSPDEDGPLPLQGPSWRAGAASRLWLQEALEALDRDLRKRYGPGAGIVYLKGPYLTALRQLAARTKARSFVWSRRYEPIPAAVDRLLEDALKRDGYTVRVSNALLLREPHEVKVDMGKWTGHFGTLMPFYRACQALGPWPKPAPAPTKLPVGESYPGPLVDGLKLEDLGLYRPVRRKDGGTVDWAEGIRRAWRFDEQAALDALRNFIQGQMGAYESDRGFADGRAVSKLSPYLHFGQLSPRFMMQELERAKCKDVSKTFYRRLIWRDLAYWQNHHWPAMAELPIRAHYAERVPWTENDQWLKAWQRGTTGFPLIDAGMRELWATGWQQQNVRMAVAAFLTEYLNLNWVEGAAWFHDTLVDADVINWMMWQNAGKTGLDAWNFTVTPTSAASDPSGAYIRRWVPELAQLPTKYLREPWSAPPEVLSKAGVVLGVTYPHRITTDDMTSLRNRNAELMRQARFQSPEWIDKDGYDMIVVPPGATVGHDGKKMRIFTKHEYRTPEGDGKAPRGVPKAAKGGAGRGQEGGEGSQPSTSGVAGSPAGAGGAKKGGAGAGKGAGVLGASVASGKVKGAVGRKGGSGAAGSGSAAKRRRGGKGGDAGEDDEVLAGASKAKAKRGQRLLTDFVRVGKVDDSFDLDLN